MARERAALGLLPEALLIRATGLFYLGRWDAAVADNHEAIELARATDQPSVVCEANGNLARIHAFRGHDAVCRTHLAEYLRLARDAGMTEYEDFAGVYLGELALTRGEFADAIEHLAPTNAVQSISRARAGLIEAYVRVGRRADARESLADLARLVERSNSQPGRVFVARLRGLLAENTDDAITAFDAAIAAAGVLAWPLETARTELLFGERLRRDRRRREARIHLIRAVDLFARLGADPWAERARTELSASGQRVQRSARSGDA